MQKLTISLIDFYRNFLSFDRGILMVLSPGGACKFEQTCSEYMKVQILKKGVIKGLGLGIVRILKCR